jgi:hypothetical protein
MAFTRCPTCISALGFAKKLLKEGLLESSLHKTLSMEKVVSKEGEEGGFAYLNRCLEEKPFHERAFEAFANQVYISFSKLFCFW